MKWVSIRSPGASRRPEGLLEALEAPTHQTNFDENYSDALPHPETDKKLLYGLLQSNVACANDPYAALRSHTPLGPHRSSVMVSFHVTTQELSRNTGSFLE